MGLAACSRILSYSATCAEHQRLWNSARARKVVDANAEDQQFAKFGYQSRMGLVKQLNYR